MPLQILCAPGDSSLLPVLEKQYNSGEFHFSPWQSDKISDAAAIFVPAPIFYEARYLLNAELWKNFYAQHAPNIPVICVSMQATVAHPNVLHRLDLPGDLHRFLKKAYPNNDFWAFPQLHGIRADQMLLRFSQGHGRDGYTENLSQLKKKVGIITDHLRDGIPIELPREIIYGDGHRKPLREIWQSFKTRWVNYMPYFVALPFSDLLEAGNLLVEEADRYFRVFPDDMAAFATGEALEALETLKNTLLNIEEYVQKDLQSTGS